MSSQRNWPALQAQTGAIGADRGPEMAYMQHLPWWRKPYRMQAVGLAVVVIAALLGGWAISEMQKPVLPDFDFSDSSQLTAEEQTTTPPETEATQTTETQAPAAEEQPLDMAGMDWAVPDPSPADAQAETDASQQSAVMAPTPLSHDDIGTLDLSKQEEVEKLLGVDSESAATALNTIEPSTPVPPSQQTEAIPPLKTEPFKVDQASLKNPKDLIKPDTSLPDVVKQIEAKAFENVPEAQHDLAAVYTAGHGGVKQDYKRAAFWFEQAADRGIANAAYNLGVLYHQGLGVKANLETALDWYRKAATMGHPEAQYNLGIAYIEGIGVGYDPVKAAQYFKSAADQDIMEAAYNLGLIYENGLLGNAKPDEALMWYKTAADKGSPEARQALEQLAKSLNIKLEDVNRLAESMKVMKKSDATPAVTPTLAPTEKQASAEETVNAGTSVQAITAQVQEYLVRMGLFPGPADGVMGPLTGDAIRSYQKMHGLNPDGLATEGLLTHMLASATPTDEEGGLEEGSREF
jgi:TPR repeat protein